MMLKFCTYSGGVPGKDTCTGEGGAPLVCLDKDKDQFFAVGIICFFWSAAQKPWEPTISKFGARTNPIQTYPRQDHS